MLALCGEGKADMLSLHLIHPMFLHFLLIILNIIWEINRLQSHCNHRFMLFILCYQQVFQQVTYVSLGASLKNIKEVSTLKMEFFIITLLPLCWWINYCLWWQCHGGQTDLPGTQGTSVLLALPHLGSGTRTHRRNLKAGSSDILFICNMNVTRILPTLDR